MSIGKAILKLLDIKEITLEEIAQILSTKSKKIKSKTLHRKLLNGEIKYLDVQKILDILGYTIQFEKINK